MNHCLLEVEVIELPQVRYTQDNQTPVAEMAVRFDGLRPEDPPGEIKVVGWGTLAQDLQNRVQVGQRLVIEGRLRMNTVPRPGGLKEKRAEFTLSRLHPLHGSGAAAPVTSPADAMEAAAAAPAAPRPAAAGVQRRQPAGPPPASAEASPSAGVAPPVWNTSPLVPQDLEEEDEIPF